MLNIITYLSNNIVLFLCNKDVISVEDKSIYQYGSEIILSTIVGFSLILISGLLLKELMLAIVFLCIFVPLRMFTGGYHADTYLRCNCIFVMLFWLMIGCLKVLSTHFTLPVIILFCVFTIITIICYAPVENENKPLSNDEKRKHKTTGIILSSLYSVAIIALSFVSIKLAVSATLTLLIVTVLILYQKVKDGKKHEKLINNTSAQNGKN